MPRLQLQEPVRVAVWRNLLAELGLRSLWLVRHCRHHDDDDDIGASDLFVAHTSHPARSCSLGAATSASVASAKSAAVAPSAAATLIAPSRATARSATLASAGRAAAALAP